MKLNYIRIELHPFLPMKGEPDLQVLKIEVVVDGTRTSYEQVVAPDDLESYFDVVWKRAGVMLKERITGVVVTRAEDIVT